MCCFNMWKQNYKGVLVICLKILEFVWWVLWKSEIKLMLNLLVDMDGSLKYEIYILQLSIPVIDHRSAKFYL